MTQFFKYNVLREFNFAFVGHVEDLFNNEDLAVTLMDGRKCIVKAADRHSFYEAFEVYKQKIELKGS